MTSAEDLLLLIVMSPVEESPIATIFDTLSFSKKLTFEMFGVGTPVGNTVKKPLEVASAAVIFATTEVAPTGIEALPATVTFIELFGSSVPPAPLLLHSFEVTPG